MKALIGIVVLAGLGGAVAWSQGGTFDMGRRGCNGRPQPDDRRPRPGDNDRHQGPGRGPRQDERGYDERGPRRPRNDERGQDAPRPDDRRQGESWQGDAFSDDLPLGTVLFRGGHETDRRDGGRPVVLIAAALGVSSDVFRDAFSRVNPARGGDPSPALARANKQVLMDALGPHGITNERLDEVSNYYRYQPQSGRLWRHTAATATAMIEEGKIVRLKITNPGSGYSSPPRVTVVGYEDLQVKASLEFSQEFSQNGRIGSLTIEPVE